MLTCKVCVMKPVFNDVITIFIFLCLSRIFTGTFRCCCHSKCVLFIRFVELFCIFLSEYLEFSSLAGISCRLQWLLYHCSVHHLPSLFSHTLYLPRVVCSNIFKNIPAQRVPIFYQAYWSILQLTSAPRKQGEVYWWVYSTKTNTNCKVPQLGVHYQQEDNRWWNWPKQRH